VLLGLDRFWPRHSVVDDQHQEIFRFGICSVTNSACGVPARMADT
jgi:hypothetical protein